jgi:hypothetical protein
MRMSRKLGTIDCVPSAGRRPRLGRPTTLTMEASAATAVGHSSVGQIRGQKRPLCIARKVDKTLIHFVTGLICEGLSLT